MQRFGDRLVMDSCIYDGALRRIVWKIQNLKSSS